MFDLGREEEHFEITVTKKDGTLKWQWQDNFIWRYLQRKTGKDIRILILTGYPTKLYKFKAQR